MNLTALTGGASRMTWALEALTDGRRRSLILRTGLPDTVHAGMELEARAQRAAAAAGAPVPHVVVAEDSVAALGNPFLICDAIGGETMVRRIQRRLDEPGRAQLLRQCAEALVAIHRADKNLPGITTATFEWVFRWLADNRPARSPLRLVHGDFRMGNLIVDESGLAAVLDWELVHVGSASGRGDSVRLPTSPPADWAASRTSFRVTRQQAARVSTVPRFTGGWCRQRSADGRTGTAR